MRTTTSSSPEIDANDLQAVRDFLAAVRDDLPPPPPPRSHRQASTKTHVTVRNGITRARNRSAARKAEV